MVSFIWIMVNSQTDRIVDRPTRRQNVVLVDKNKSQLVDTKGQLVDTKKPTRRHPKSQLVDTQKVNRQAKYIVATGPIYKFVYDLTFFGRNLRSSTQFYFGLLFYFFYESVCLRVGPIPFIFFICQTESCSLSFPCYTPFIITTGRCMYTVY